MAVEPLSIAASILTLLDASSRFRSLCRHVCGASEGLRELLDDTARTEDLLKQMSSAAIDTEGQSPHLRMAVDLAKEKLLKLQQLIEYDVKKAGESTKTDRWQWMRKGRQAEKLLQQLKDIHSEFSIYIGLANL